MGKRTRLFNEENIMTTVINLNILNVIKLKLNRFTVNDIRFNAQVSDERHNSPAERDDVIDITPYSRVVTGNELDIKKDTKYPVSRPHQSRSVMRAEVIDRTYDRRGNSVEYSQPKGMHVDSYA